MILRISTILHLGNKYIKYNVHGSKNHAFLKGFLDEDDLEINRNLTVNRQGKGLLQQKSYFLNQKIWWRSDKIEIGANPYNADISSRNWILNEVNFYHYHY